MAYVLAPRMAPTERAFWWRAAATKTLVNGTARHLIGQVSPVGPAWDACSRGRWRRVHRARRGEKAWSLGCGGGTGARAEGLLRWPQDGSPETGTPGAWTRQQDVGRPARRAPAGRQLGRSW
jgi:hypothetical protein